MMVEDENSLLSTVLDSRPTSMVVAVGNDSRKYRHTQLNVELTSRLVQLGLTTLVQILFDMHPVKCSLERKNRASGRLLVIAVS